MLIKNTFDLRLYLLFSIAVFAACSPKPHYLNGNSIIINERFKSDSLVAQWLQPLTDSMALQMNEVIAWTPVEFRPIRSKGRITQNQQHEATLARLVSDYTLNWSQKYARKNKYPIPELAILNHNGLRNSIDSGNVTRGDIFEVMPFDNEIVLLILTGTQMIDLFDYVAKIGGTPLSGGILYLDSTRITKAIINGNAFDSRRSYCIATVDFMQTGGDGFTMLKNPKRLIQTGTFLRDVIFEQIQTEVNETKGTLKARPNPRIFHTNSH